MTYTVLSARYGNADRDAVIAQTVEAGGVMLPADHPALEGVTIAAYVAPPPPVPQSITMRQLLIGLQADAWITPQEAEAWAARTALPANVQAVIDAMPEAERPAARITAFTMSAAYRDDLMLLAAAQAAMPDATPDEIAAVLDDAFRRWSLL